MAEPWEDVTLGDMQYWRLRIEWAEMTQAAIYVYPEEVDEIRAVAAGHHKLMQWQRPIREDGMIRGFVRAVPVVVGEAKAREQMLALAEHLSNGSDRPEDQ